MMRISDEIDHVMREFVAFEDLFYALTEEQGIETYQVASWFTRNQEQFSRLVMLECNPEARDFRVLETNWSSDAFFDLSAGEDFDWNADTYPGFRPGWLETDLRQFFKLTRVDYPETALLARQKRPRLAVPESEKPEVTTEQADGDGEHDRPVATRERTTLLTIIAALAEEAKIPLVTPSKSAEIIAGLTDKMGASVGKRTIEEHLKKVTDALERKSR